MLAFVLLPNAFSFRLKVRFCICVISKEFIFWMSSTKRSIFSLIDDAVDDLIVLCRKNGGQLQ